MGKLGERGRAISRVMMGATFPLTLPWLAMIIAPVTTPDIPSVITNGEIFKEGDARAVQKADESADEQRNEQGRQHLAVLAFDDDIGKDGRQRDDGARRQVNALRSR